MKNIAHIALFSAALLTFAGCSQTPDKNSSQAAKKDTAQTDNKDTAQTDNKDTAQTDNKDEAQAKSDAKPVVDPFIKFKRKSIEEDARLNIKTIAEGALSWFQGEHPTDPTGTSYFTKQYPKSPTVSQIGPVVGEKTIGKTHRISPEDYKQSPDAFGMGVWEQMHFNLSTETYYTYILYFGWRVIYNLRQS